MSSNGNNNCYEGTTILNQFFDGTFHQLFIIDDYGDSIVVQNVDEIIEKVILY